MLYFYYHIFPVLFVFDGGIFERMSGMRLIDANLLMRKCEKWLKPKAPAEDEMVSLTDIAVSMLMEIEEQPTAFDVDSVVNELKRGKFIESETVLSDIHQGYNAGLGRAIEIVKRGGRDEE